MISSSDFRTGLTLEIDNGVWQIVDFQHVNQVKVQLSFVQKLKTYRLVQL